MKKKEKDKNPLFKLGSYTTKEDGIRGTIWVNDGDGSFLVGYPILGLFGNTWIPVAVDADGNFNFSASVTVAPTTWQNFAQGTPDQVAVTNASTVLLDANPDRLFASFTNNSTQTVYLQYGVPAAWMTGFPLFPNATRTITLDELFTGQVSAITLTGTVNIDVIEGVK